MRINAADLERLAGLKAKQDKGGILSLYLPIDPRAPTRDDLRARAMDVLRELREGATPLHSERVNAESDRVLDYLRREYVPHGTCLAMFSGEPSKTWEVFSFQLPSPALARFGDSPYLLPIDAFSDDYRPAMVAVVSQEKARFIRVSMGELLAESELTTDVPGLQRQGGWAAARFEQERLHHIDEHLRRVAAWLAEEQISRPFERLVLGGTSELTHELIPHLSGDLRSRVAGSVPMEMFASSSDVISTALPTIEAAESSSELQLVKRLIDMALAGGQAALGLDETLQMLREGRARSLVVAAEGAFKEPGEGAFALATANGLDVEVVHGEAAALLQPYAGLAAELRF